MKIRNIQLCYRSLKNGRSTYKYFSDWYDFADWIKQENLYNREITVVSWQYVDVEL